MGIENGTFVLTTFFTNSTKKRAFSTLIYSTAEIGANMVPDKFSNYDWNILSFIFYIKGMHVFKLAISYL